MEPISSRGKTVDQLILPYLKSIEDKFEYSKVFIVIRSPYMYIEERYDDGVDETGMSWYFDIIKGVALPNNPDMGRGNRYFPFYGTFEIEWDDNDHIVGLTLVVS